MALTQISTEGIKNGTITGSDLATNVDLVDNQKLRLGTSSDKSEIYNDGDDLFINHTEAGYLQLQGNYGVLLQRHNGTENLLRALSNGAVELYYDNSKKFETLSTGAAVTGELDVSGTIDMNTDTGRLKIGAGDDLQLYHDGTNSYIANNGGQLRIWAKTDGYAMIAAPDAQVELYYNNSKKFETYASGIKATGNILTTTGDISCASDSQKVTAGAGDDLQMFHDGTDSRITNTTGALQITGNNDLRFKTNSGQNIFKATGNAVELYYDTGSGGSSKKFNTNSEGVSVHGNLALNAADNYKIYLGASNDLQIFHESSSNDNIIDCATTRPLRIRFGGSNQFEFLSGGGIKMNDGRKIILGDSSDFQMYHDGSNSVIAAANTGDLQIFCNSDDILLQAVDNIFIKPQNGESGITVIGNGAVELFYANNKKLETTSGGVNVTGALTVNGSALTSATNSPAFSVKLSSTTNRNGEGTVVFDSELLDTDSCYNTSNGRFTPDVAGNYMLTFTFVMNGSSSGIIAGAFGAIRKNGSTIIARFWTDPMQANNNQLNRASCSGSAIVPMNGSTDFIEIRAYGLTTTGGNVRISDDGSNFSGFKLA